MHRIYAAAADRLVVAAGDGAVERAVGRRPECLAVTAARPERVLVGTFGSGLHRSTDGGETFASVTFPAEAVTALAVSPHDPDTVWAGTEPSAVYRSTDGGVSWERRPGLTDLPSASRWSFPPRPDTHHVRWIEPDPHDPGRLYVGIEAGALVRTTDGGETWLDHPEGARRDNHTLATHPDEPGLVYAAAGDGFAVSRDGGDGWTYPQEGLGHRYCWSVAVDPGDPSRLLLSAASGPRSAHTAATAESYVYRRAGGEPWRRVESDTLPTGEGALRTMLATTGEPGVVYAGTDRGVFRSRDFGASWERTADGWPDAVDGQTVRDLAVV